MASLAREAEHRSHWLAVVVAAVLLTAINVSKPVHIDEGVYLIYAEEFSKHPSNPYGFEFQSPAGSTANDLLVAPAIPCWLAVGMRVLGPDPTALRYWMFPVALLLTWAADFLSARFAPSLRRPVFWLLVFSPTVVPSFSFMFDVPVMAFGFAAVALTMRSIERNSWGLALAAGVVAGLAIETKYIGGLSCVALFVWCLFNRRPLRGFAICACAAAIFIGWECFVAYGSGDSHFMVHFKGRQGGSARRMVHLILPFLSQMGGLAVAPALLGFRALGKNTKAIVAFGVAVLIGIGIHSLFPSQSGLFPRANGRPSVTISTLVYGLLSIPVWIAVCRVNSQLVRREGVESREDRLLDWFIPCWMLIEIAGCFLLAPTPGARRVFNAMAVFTLGVGRLAHRRQTAPRAAWGAAAFSAALTLLYCYVNLLDARAGKQAIEDAVAKVAAVEAAAGGEPARKYGYDRSGWTGATYYFHQAGWPTLRSSAAYAPRPGDLIAVADLMTNHVDGLPERPELKVERVGDVTIGDDMPLRLALRYYSGGFPLEHQHEGRVKVQIFRVLSGDSSTNEPPPVQADRRNDGRPGKTL